MYTMSKPSMERIAEVLASESSMDENENGEKVVPDGSISFENVNFGYKEGLVIETNNNIPEKTVEEIAMDYTNQVQEKENIIDF